MISDYEDIAEFILNNYRNKVVEIGVGNLPHVALLLKDKMDVIVTDINEQKYAGVRFCRDDIFAPDMGIYRNASLLYSIRPPIDIQDAMAKTATEAGADLIIRPFGNEKADIRKYYKDYKLVNYKKARFYLYRFADITSSSP
ncbi:MAG: UPF0146 family protein [Candidatus Methanoperedens sp.]|nr:UPF0146 family protein [Candidatus Methanoperedens sp.]